MCAQNLYRDKGRKNRPPKNKKLWHSRVGNKARRAVHKNKTDGNSGGENDFWSGQDKFHSVCKGSISKEAT